MSGDVQVRFCERPGVRFPRATHRVMVFEREDDARRVMAVLPKRFEKYALRLHPEKTRLVRFTRPPRNPDGRGSPDAPGSFDFLGFTHHWARSLKGNWVVKQRTAKNRMSRTLHAIAHWCRENRHEPVREQHRKLSQKLRGHDAYFGITGNHEALKCLRHAVERIWYKWLSRRSWKARLTWKRMRELLRAMPLPPPRAVHSVLLRAANP